MENLNYFELIKERESCRDFADAEVEPQKIQTLINSLPLCDTLENGIGTQLEIVDGETAAKFGKSVGYNGFMIDAPQYALLFTEEKGHYLENAGFIMQAITLKMVSMDLAACWLTVNDAAAAKTASGVDTDKTLAVVVGFGYRNKKKKGTRLDIKSMSDVKINKNSVRTAPKIALSEFVFQETFGNNADTVITPKYPQLEDALLCMSTAQSFFNRQPYRVVLTNSAVCLVGLDDDMTEEEDTHLNYGIVMFNFYAVHQNTRGGGDSMKHWTFDAPAEDLKLPANTHFVAQCKL